MKNTECLIYSRLDAQPGRLFKTFKASKAERLKALEFVCQNPHYIQKLFDLAVTPSAARIHIYATWVWELYLLEEPRKLDPYW